MVDIISKRDGPLPQDAKARRFLAENQSVVTGLADQLTSGGYSAGKRQKAQRDAENQAALQVAESTRNLPASARDSGEIRVKVSVNNRVVGYDLGSGRQVHLFGEIRRQDGMRYFVYASRENGFYTVLPDEINEKLIELDGQIIDHACPESLLAAEIAERLGV